MNLRRLEWYARQLDLPLSGASGEATGAGRAVLRGQGLVFAGHREYQYGDDVRAIDWNATARFARPFVKTFHEDRMFDLLILVDVSASLGSAADPRAKQMIARELAALFVFVALRQDERVALVLFSDVVEWQQGLGRGRAHTNVLLRALSDKGATSRGTDLPRALTGVHRLLRRPGFVIVISDFVAEGYEDALRAVARRHDTLALALADPRDAEPPDVGLVRVADAETGRALWMDTTSATARTRIRANWLAAQAARRDRCRRAGVAALELLTDRPYFETLRAACHAHRARHTA